MIKKGEHISPSTEFKKGHIPWSKGTKGLLKGYWKGKYHSKATKRKMSERKKGIPSPFKNGKNINCAQCGKIFYLSKSRLGKRKFCSQKCMGKYRTGKPMNVRENNPNWGGGIKTSGAGKYIEILMPQHPFADKYGYIKRSHLVIEKKIGRYLTRKEVVHHKGIHFPIKSIENTQDDSPENLQLFPNNSEHIRFHRLNPMN